PHVRPREPEVEELLRIDLGELPRPPGPGQKARRRRRRLGGVVPAAEREEHDGAPHGLGRLVDDQRTRHRYAPAPGLPASNWTAAGPLPPTMSASNRASLIAPESTIRLRSPDGLSSIGPAARHHGHVRGDKCG